jgi:hypothetical protein
VVREDDRVGEWREYPPREAMEEVTDKERVVVSSGMFVKKFQKGGSVIRSFYAGENLFVVTGSCNGHWA